MRLNGSYLSLLICCLALPMSLMARNTQSTKAVTTGASVIRPLLFVENKGQFTDANFAPRKDILFRLSSPGMNIMLGDASLHYMFQKKSNDDKCEMYRVDVSLVGANTHARVETDGQQEYEEHYYMPHVSQDPIFAHSFNKVIYKDVYPGIDWVFYVKNNELEYDFVVKPGADASLIRIKYDGAADLALNADGSVKITSPLGTITEKAPLAYIREDNEIVPMRFNVNRNVLSFNASKTKGTLVIDPVLKWATYYGGNGSDIIYRIDFDPSGNIFAVGSTGSTNQIATSGAFQTANAGGFDAFLVKFSPNGSIVWGTYFGGTGTDYGYGVSVDNVGNAYICGNTTSAGLSTAGAAQTTNAGPTGGGGSTGDAYIAKFTNNGYRVWCTYKGGTGNEQGFGIFVNAAYQLFLCGNTASTSGVASATAYQSTNQGPTSFGGQGDAFLCKYDTAGNFVWGTLYGGTGTDIAQGVISDASGNNIYITGNTASGTLIASSGAYQTTYGGCSGCFGGSLGDAFLACFNSAGTALTWGTYIGGPAQDNAWALAIDGSNNLYVGGQTVSASGLATSGAYNPVFSGPTAGFGSTGDGFLAKFSGTGTNAWVTYYGTDSNDVIYDVAVDQTNNVWVIGSTRGDTGLTTASGYQLARGGVGSSDAFFASFNGTGARQYASYFGGSLQDVGQAIGCSRTGKMQTVIGGYTYSTSNIATSGAYQTTYGGAGSSYGDGFLAQFEEDTIVTITLPFTDTILCATQSFSFPYTVNHQFAAGNVFTVQLSNAAGSFAAPVNIGSVTLSIAGNITATIPGGTASGAGYRVRIISTSPIDTSVIDNKNITVFSLVAPTLTYVNPICVGDSIKFTAVNNNAVTVSYAWTGPLAFSSALQNPARANATTSMAGNYTATISYPGCASVASNINVVVNSIIPATPTASSNAPVCQYATLNLYSNSVTSGVSYSWTGPNGYTANIQNPVITNVPFGAAGNYMVYATLNGCKSASDTINVNVNPSLVPAISIISNPISDTVCAGALLTYIANTVNAGNNPTFQWYTKGAGASVWVPVVGAISNNWGNQLFGNGDSVYCQLTISATGGCVSQTQTSSNAMRVNIYPSEMPFVLINVTPGTTITPGTSVTFNSTVMNAGANPTFQWLVNGIKVPAPFGTASTYTTQALLDSSLVQLIVYSNATCPSVDSVLSSTILMHVSNNAGVSNMTNIFDQLSFYPNPSNGTFTVSGVVNSNELKIDVLNTLGQIVYTEMLNVQSSIVNKQINLNVADGVYILHVSAAGQQKVYRMLIAK